MNLGIANKQSLHDMISVKRVSDLSKLIRVTAFILCYVRNIREQISKNELIVDELKHQEIEQARLRWLLANEAKIKEDVNFCNLKSNLILCEDEDKLLLCKGRIGNAPCHLKHTFQLSSLERDILRTSF